MRRTRRFAPEAWEGLEHRLVLSHVALVAQAHGHAQVRAHAPARPPARVVQHPSAKLSPAAEINQEVASFNADFVAAEGVFVQSIPATAPSSSSSSTTTSDNTGSVFQSYFTARALVMAQNLTTYFNSLRVSLPRTGGPPGVNGNPSSIQIFLQQTIVGSSPTSLTQQLLAIPLPTTSGPGVVLYAATAENVIDEIHSQMLSGAKSLFQGNKSPVHAAPATTTPAQVVPSSTG